MASQPCLGKPTVGTSERDDRLGFAIATAAVVVRQSDVAIFEGWGLQVLSQTLHFVLVICTSAKDVECKSYCDKHVALVQNFNWEHLTSNTNMKAHHTDTAIPTYGEHTPKYMAGSNKMQFDTKGEIKTFTVFTSWVGTKQGITKW